MSESKTKVLVQVDTQSTTSAEAESTMPDIVEKPPRRLHDLALAQSKMSVVDEFDAIVAERKQHYAEIAAKHPRVPVPTTLEEAQNIIFNHVQTESTKLCLQCFKEAKAN